MAKLTNLPACPLLLQDESIALCLTPQGYHNIRPGTDIFNNVNLGFWEYILPGETRCLQCLPAYLQPSSCLPPPFTELRQACQQMLLAPGPSSGKLCAALVLCAQLSTQRPLHTAGYDALGYIACTGTNFALRINALK
jgi:hypothetical protein